MGIKKWRNRVLREALERDPGSIPNALLWQEVISRLEGYSLAVHRISPDVKKQASRIAKEELLSIRASYTYL
jgi:hypothetical protein